MFLTSYDDASALGIIPRADLMRSPNTANSALPPKPLSEGLIA
ncbi:hypothetical protein [Nodosilinea sp. E11]|nr:hypothetical protein [Nodosilinea sp. E11]WOD38278.1 hypothetical protein RRF56_18875 [Nodosilinea sp. E11]